MSAYVPIDFEDGVTPLNAATFDQLEQGLVVASQDALDALAGNPPDPTGLDEKWLKAESGAMVWVDAPTGGGSSIEYENAWGAATPYLPGDVVEHEGVQYLAVNPSTGDEPAPAAAPSPTVIPLVTTLPALPFDGQEVILTDSLTAPTFQWRLRYRAGSTHAEKWEFVGGSSVASVLNTLESTTTAGAWVNLATVGPQVTIPLSGVYEVTMSASAVKNAIDSITQAGVGIGDFTTELVQAVGSIFTNGAWIALSASSVLAGLTAGTILRMRYYQALAGTLQVQKRVLLVRPVRVS